MSSGAASDERRTRETTMKLFLDTADVEAIRKAQATGLLDGVTTNPVKVAQTGRPFLEVVREICRIVPGPVSAEAMAETAEDLVAEAERIAAIAPNIVVKVPMTPAGLTAACSLERDKNVRVNVTMIFSATQALLAMKTGASYVSIVLSRLDAIANESDYLIRDAVAIKRNYAMRSQIIAGSVKTQNTLLSCLRSGVDIATVPEALFEQMFKHPLTDAGLAEFQREWRKVPT
jgi:transaldolase